jgi:hypothetical protein
VPLRGLLHVELLRHLRLLPDQAGQLAQVGQLVAEADQAEALLRLVRDPPISFRQLGEVLP